jgi:hypothetical protein
VSVPQNQNRSFDFKEDKAKYIPYYNNSFFIDLGVFVRSFELEGFQSYKVNATNKPTYRTYMNMSDIGIKLNSGTPLALVPFI